MLRKNGDLPPDEVAMLISGKQKELFEVQAIQDSKKVRQKGGAE